MIYDMEIRQANINDLDNIVRIEQTCFNQAKAATYDSLKSRLETYAQGYYVLIDYHQIIGYVGGLKNNLPILPDEMYHDSSLHCEDGQYQMIFSLCILPFYQKRGYARQLLMTYIDIMKKENLKGIVLTCENHLLDFYQSCGFQRLGISASTHGGVKWNDMLLQFL